MLLVLVCSACSSGTEETIVGQWRSNEESVVFYSNIEFFSDGTHVTETPGWSGTYTAENSRLRISGKLYSEVFSYELSDGEETLVLSDELGNSIIYNRVH